MRIRSGAAFEKAVDGMRCMKQPAAMRKTARPRYMQHDLQSWLSIGIQKKPTSHGELTLAQEKVGS
jgi:hypothetical protein